LAAGEVAAMRVLGDEKGPKLDLDVLVQPWFQVSGPYQSGRGSDGVGAPSGTQGNGATPGEGENPSFDPFVRSAAAAVRVTYKEWIRLMFSIEQSNIGRWSSFSPQLRKSASPLRVRDAFATFEFRPELILDAGLFVVPFSHHNLESFAALHTLELHSDLMRFHAGRAYRDAGFELRGVVAKRFAYRAGVFEGARNYGALETPIEPVGANYPEIAEHGLPRFTGHARVNLLGEEPDFFFKGIYFSTTPIVSVGVGADYQPDAVLKLDQSVGAYSAFSADVFVEVPLSTKDEILFKAGAFRWGEGWSRMLEASALEAGGYSAYGELGFRHSWLEPHVYLEWMKTDATDVAPVVLRDSQIIAPHAGVNFWIDQHAVNVKLDAGYRKVKRDVKPPFADAPWSTVNYTDLFATVGLQVSL
jgi:hypothetical protein